MTHNLKLPLFLTRIFIVLFMLPWQLTRFTSPEIINTISTKYYKFTMPAIGSTITGVFMMGLLLAFLVGFKKRISYGLILVFHTIGTIMTIPFMIPGTENFRATFLAAIPTIGAMLLLYYLRDEDTMLSLNK